MKFWEFPFGVEVEAPDIAIEELERLARLFAGTNWGMEFEGTAMHFRFKYSKNCGKFIRACRARNHFILGIPGTKGVASSLILKCASASRPSGEWNADDFDVAADGAVVGRLFKAGPAPVGSRV